ncbi:MAG: flagellar hook-length control protein FliK [Clostridiales bacterium]|nr:flagellar hook-length control protein FliK [Clostridiales bacterium]
MPSIWNINNINSSNNKKVSGKLTFEVGEKFSGKIIGKDENNEVIVKLSDGWQFTAEIDGEINPDEQSLIRFVVEGFDEGKLKLKVVQGDNKNNTETINSNLANIIEKEGLQKEDIDLLKSMIKHNIPLTRENIINAKSLIQFNENINKNPEEMRTFIDNFLASKNIEPLSENGQNIKTILSDFFSTFKNMPKEDILFFLENNIEMTKENIESFNKLFKGDTNLSRIFNDMESSSKLVDTQDVKSQVLPKTIEEPKDTINKAINNSKVEDFQKENKINNENKFVTNAYDKTDNYNNKISMLSLLKSMVGSETEITKEVLKNLLAGKASEFSFNEYNNILSELDKLTDNKLFKMIFNESVNNGGYSKEVLNKVVSEIFNKQISINDEEFKKLTDVIKTIKGEMFEEITAKVKENINKGNETIINSNKIIGNNMEESSKDLIKKDIKVKIDDIREAVKDLINKSQNTDIEEKSKKIMEFIKSNINEFKLFNNVSNEYYYLDIPIKNKEDEYPCKLIIKDNRKEGKIIDKNNVKLVVSVKTINLGEIDGYISISDQALNLEMKCEKKYVRLLNKGKDKLIEGLSKIGYFPNVMVVEKKDNINISSCREFFSYDNARTIDTKV